MANTLHACSSCHHKSNGCNRELAASDQEPCPRYEARTRWLARQIDAIRRAETTTRLLLAVGVVGLFFPVAAWVVLNDGDTLTPQAHRPVMKVLTASASGDMTSTR